MPASGHDVAKLSFCQANEKTHHTASILNGKEAGSSVVNDASQFAAYASQRASDASQPASDASQLASDACLVACRPGVSENGGPRASGADAASTATAADGFSLTNMTTCSAECRIDGNLMSLQQPEKNDDSVGLKDLPETVEIGRAHV